MVGQTNGARLDIGSGPGSDNVLGDGSSDGILDAEDDVAFGDFFAGSKISVTDSDAVIPANVSRATTDRRGFPCTHTLA